MEKLRVFAAVFGFAVGVFTVIPAGAWDRGKVDILAVLPDAAAGQPSSVEGLTVGPDGNIYVPTFGFNAKGALTGNAVLYVIRPDGDLVRQVPIANSSPPPSAKPLTAAMTGIGRSSRLCITR